MKTHDLSQNQVNLNLSSPGLRSVGKFKIKDSVLLFIVFIIGLLGSFYILHMALTQGQSHIESSLYDENQSILQENFQTVLLDQKLINEQVKSNPVIRSVNLVLD